MSPSKVPPKRGKGGSVKRVVLLAIVLSVLCMALGWNPFGGNDSGSDGTQRLGSLKRHMPLLLTRRGSGGGGNAWGHRADTLGVVAPALEDDAGAAELEGVGAEQETESATAETIESAHAIAAAGVDATAAAAAEGSDASSASDGVTAGSAHSAAVRGEPTDEELEAAIREAMDALASKNRARARDALMALGPRAHRVELWKVGGPHIVPVLATSFTTQCTSGHHLIHHIEYRCSPRLPPHRIPVLAVSSTTQCTGARHVVHCKAYHCSQPLPPHNVRCVRASVR
jgi:hypothetical protein